MADDEFEEELLEVVGRTAAPTSTGSKKRSKRAADSDDEDDEDLLALSGNDEEDQRGRGAKGKKASKKPATKRQRGASREEEEHEGDGDADGAGDLYFDEEDRRKLQAMTELERELILAERAEQRDQARQRKELLKKARETEQKGSRMSGRQKKSSADKDSAIRQIEAARKRQGKGKKGKPSSSRDWSDDDADEASEGEEDEEDEEEEEPEYEDSEEDEEEAGGRKGKKSVKKAGKGRKASTGISDEEEDGEEGERPAWRATTRSGAAAAVVAAQDQAQRGSDTSQRGVRGEEDGEEGEEAPLRGMRRESYAADEDEEGEVGRPGKAGGAGEEDEDDEELADAHELRQIQLTRLQLESMVDKPFFEGEGLTGALVRMAYGPPMTDKDSRTVPTYWMMQIVSIKEGTSTYPFGPKGKPCNKKLELRDGMRTLRVLPMSNASNQPLEDIEIERFARHAGRVNERAIGKQQVAEVRRKIQDAVNYRWDSAQVRELIERKKEARAREGVSVNEALEKQTLKRELEHLIELGAARTEEHEEKLAKLQAQLKLIEERLEQRAQKDRSLGMMSINARNKEANFNLTIRNVGNRPANSTDRKGGAADPFSRRQTRPTLQWKGKDQADGGVKVSSPAKLGVNGAPGGGGKALNASMARLDPSELIKVLDLDVDVRTLDSRGLVPPLHLRLLGPRWHQSLRTHAPTDLAGKHVFSLQEWDAYSKGGAGDGDGSMMQ